MIGRTAGIRSLDNRVFRIETGKTSHSDNPDPGNRQRPRHHRPEGQRDALPQTAIITHVLLVVHGVDYAAGAQKQQRLEESVREQMEHGDAVSTATCGEEHIAQL